MHQQVKHSSFLDSFELTFSSAASEPHPHQTMKLPVYFEEAAEDFFRKRVRLEIGPSGCSENGSSRGAGSSKGAGLDLGFAFAFGNAHLKMAA